MFGYYERKVKPQVLNMLEAHKSPLEALREKVDSSDTCLSCNSNMRVEGRNRQVKNGTDGVRRGGIKLKKF